MADKTRAQMITMVLERLGVLAAGQSASSEDVTVVGEVVDSLHGRLRADRLAPFASSAFPDWAQVPFADIAADELASEYGVGGERAAKIDRAARRGRIELARQVAAKKPNVPVRGRYF